MSTTYTIYCDDHFAREARSQHLDRAASAGYEGRDVGPYLTGHESTDDESALPSDGEVRWAHLEGQAMRLLDERAAKVAAWRAFRRAVA